jgi:ParB-like chromosome segregation protein Spo0J
MKTVKIKDLIIREPFNGLFPVVTSIKDEIIKDIKAHGFSAAHPLIVWQEPGQKAPTLIDGHMRVSASSVAGLTEVPIYERKFSDERDALTWMFSEQVERRRNLTTQQARAFLFKAIKALDSFNGHGGNRGGFHGNQHTKGDVVKGSRDPLTTSKRRTAKLVGTSSATVQRVRAVLKHGDEETQNAVESGAMSVKEGARHAMANKPPTKKTAKTKTAKTKEGKTTPETASPRAALDAFYVTHEGVTARNFRNIEKQLLGIITQARRRGWDHDRGFTEPFATFLELMAAVIRSGARAPITLEHGFTITQTKEDK